ncbi:helix-turn-helix domain-containing protein [Undibacter mobilis]|uniref:DNA binding HTH domain-containing protein n=1 Tax=Undibacter mobilis TaxID=2292256 RepID=A0A371B8T4_9BRAD|nr:helix-turn-helix domain-containing protein [Undibacter mobilis]RDV04015.1 hypothetical protein DXH78_05090 [Undibacter mobilis]
MTLAGRKLADIEMSAIIETLDLVGGNRTAAAVQLGISVRTIRNKLRKCRALGLLPQSLDVGADRRAGRTETELRTASHPAPQRL